MLSTRSRVKLSAPCDTRRALVAAGVNPAIQAGVFLIGRQ
jgi:hypothetical protein